jgi:hypothetical protein
MGSSSANTFVVGDSSPLTYYEQFSFIVVRPAHGELLDIYSGAGSEKIPQSPHPRLLSFFMVLHGGLLARLSLLKKGRLARLLVADSRRMAALAVHAGLGRSDLEGGAHQDAGALQHDADGAIFGLG